jgi:HK97 family phage portal protein
VKNIIGRSLENPSTPLSDPDDWAFEAYGARRTTSGKRVSALSAFEDSAWHRGVMLVSSTCAKLPLLTYRRQGEGKVRATEHPVYQLLKKKPNREMTAFPFWQMMFAHRMTAGSGFAFIDWARNMTVRELIPLVPENVTRMRANGELIYRVRYGDGQNETILESWQVLDFRGLCWDGLDCISVARMAREQLGWGLAARAHSSIFFSNAARGGLLLEHPGEMDEEAQARFLKAWNERYAGLSNAHKTIVLEEGMKAHPIAWNAKDSQFIETIGLHVREIANFIGCPPHRLGDTTRTSHASLEQENQSFLDDIDPHLVAVEQECGDKLLSEEQKRLDSHAVEFLRAALLRADLAARGAYYTQAGGGMPWMTRDEIRSLENLNPTPGGDEFPTSGPSGQTMPGGDGGGDAPDDDPDKIGDRALRAIHERIVAQAERRMRKRLCTHARRAAAKPERFDEWLESVRDEHGPVVRDALEAPVLALCASAGHAGTELDRRVDGIFSELRRVCDAVLTAVPASQFGEHIEKALRSVEDGA